MNKQDLNVINAINTIVNEAQQRIFHATGQKCKLIVAPDYDSEIKNDPVGMLTVVANALGLTMVDYHKASREKKYVELRILGSYYIRTYYPAVSLKETGKLVGHKDHTTVLHYLRTASDLLTSQDASFLEKNATVLNAITQWLAQEN